MASIDKPKSNSKWKSKQDKKAHIDKNMIPSSKLFELLQIKEDEFNRFLIYLPRFWTSKYGQFEIRTKTGDVWYPKEYTLQMYEQYKNRSKVEKPLWVRQIPDVQ